MEKRYLPLLILLLHWLAVFGQEEPQGRIGIDPPSIKWCQLQSATGRIIFPEGLETAAFRAAGVMNYARLHDQSIAGTGHTKKVTAILQNLSTLPGGFSTPAPWRNEYYLTPPQNFFLGPVPWADALIAHEYRHTQQFSEANEGFTIPYKVLMGQTGWLLNTLFTQPLWFREGDAVINETIFTKGGRGRLPSFNMEYRALLMSGKHFGYDVGTWSSYKDFVPNPYRIGYYMVTKARTRFTDDTWRKVLDETYKKKGFFYPFGRSLQHVTGLPPRQLYAATLHDLDSIFKITDQSLALTTSAAISATSSDIYTNYRFPHYLPDGSVVALKNAFNEINTYYRLLPGGKEEKLFSPGIYTDDHLTTALTGQLMTWAESAFDMRWFNRDYSVIMLYDFATGKKKQLSARSRYFSPAASNNGTMVAAIQIDLLGKFSIVLLDATSGKVLREFATPDNINFSQPRFTTDDRQIIALALTNAGNGIVAVDVETGAINQLLDYTDVPVSRPFPAGDYVYFSGGYTGIDNIYAIQLSTRSLFQVTSVRFGAQEPAASSDGQKLLYSDYSAEGREIHEMALQPTTWKPVTGLVTSDIRFHEQLWKAEGFDLSANLKDSLFETKKYHALTDGLFNFYGWFPIPNVPEYGAEFYTQNIMSTFRGTLGLLYNTNEKNLHSYLRFTYAAFYPLLDGQFEYGLNRKGKVIDSVTLAPKEIRWTENIVSGGITLPFRLTRGTYRTQLNISGWYHYYDVQTRDTTHEPALDEHSFFHAVEPSLTFSHLQIQARQQVKPRWGQQLDFSYQKAYHAAPERLLTVVQLYFPGLSKTHSLNFNLTYKSEKVIDTYRFRDQFIMPRGYQSTPFETQYGIYSNYEFPFWYPDIAISSVALLQRLRMNLFFDYSIGTVAGNSNALTSTGAELFVDLRLFRLFSMSAGIRYSYAFNDAVQHTQPVQLLVTRFELAN